VTAGAAISVVAATLFTLVQLSDQLLGGLTPQFGSPTPISLRVPHGAVSFEAVPSALWDAHRVFVPVGTLLSADDPIHIAVLAFESARRPPGALMVLGTWVLFFIFSFVIASYLRKLAQNRLRLLRSQAGVFVLLVALVGLAKLMLLFTGLSVFWIPVATVPLWIGASFDRRTALVVGVATAFIVASLLQFDLFLLSVGLAQSLAAILTLVDRKHNRGIVLAGVLGGAASAALLVALMFVLRGRFDVGLDLAFPASSRLVGCLGGGLLSGVVGAAFRSHAERLLGQVPRERLHDLTDLEQPLLKRMAARAPGSWEHARAMANLAEQAAAAIKADALLVRVGAYYHDLGKSVRPKFFVENLGHDEKSPHDALPPEESADAILAHVIEGTQILREGGIPEPVVEFAYTHHGTQLVEYFWNKCQQQGNPKGLSEARFRYPGMKPQTKETAILMLVDSIEAASRTVDPPERERFEQMVQRVVFTKLGSGQLDECGLSMSDVKVIVTRMTDTLVSMRHNRIKYPWQIEKAEQFGVPARAVSLLAPPPSRRFVEPDSSSSTRPEDADTEGEASGPPARH
jgi:putative nucleotidyltransferase with HDIG domain